MVTTIITMLIAAAQLQGLEPNLVIAVATVESNLNNDAVSNVGAVGVLQLKPDAFPKYTVKELKRLEVNISLGVAHLAYMKRHCSFKRDFGWVACYNRGVTGAKRSIASIKRDNYYKKVMKEYNRLKYAKKN